MIVIYNASGALVAIAGVVLGFFAFAITRSLGVGLFVISAAWIGFGLWWWLGGRSKGIKRTAPSVFFIPLPFWAIVPGLLCAPVGFIEFSGRKDKDQNPSEVAFREIDKNLAATPVGGDQKLATTVRDALDQAKFEDKTLANLCVHAATCDSAVLVLVQISNMNDLHEDGKSSLLQTIDTAVKADPAHASKSIYVGVKGPMNYQAVQTPTFKVTRANPHTPLHAYFTKCATASSAAPQGK